MTTTSPPVGTAVAAVCAGFGRDVDENIAQIGTLIDQARRAGVGLLALPEACLGGYLSVLGAGRDGAHDETPEDLPPVMDIDGPELRRVAELAGEMTVVVGLCESDGTDRYNTAAIVSGDGVLGSHRKVHQPLGENLYYEAGEGFGCVDTPAGRVGALICYDKAFPEGARALAVDGAEVIACISAWPASRTASSESIEHDRWTQRFNLFDAARALENQVVWLASNQHGTFGKLRFVANAKVVGPGGDVLATTGTGAGMAVAELDVPGALATARRAMFHLRDRRPEAYPSALATAEPLAPVGDGRA
ncbi:putative amidohydrolase [Nocardioides luteus]|uniref:Apolipoprotein N-acyltransferase n=1 Tax=Nocardioides luteus TaxID=1844 RepID=A0ABQ5T427_9ACTN|nr:carbon-nitrogen hydrolase family protein [Nocardioides luteus]MDR7310319.1 putative amidohydrolase [Nocardioides luteus]GGR53482.1 apolipoprotein N-acyltransferase [Nocardioides luteus]GLJ69901.1 apolipoprotein N-acyltransferase [Nocardioides luteus]